MGILYQAADPIYWAIWVFVLFALMAFNELGRLHAHLHRFPRAGPRCEHRTYFSVAHLAEDTQEPVGIVSDLTACPLCGGKLRWDYAHLRHLGRATCESCGFTNPKPDYEVISVDRSQHLFTVRENSAPGAPT